MTFISESELLFGVPGVLPEKEYQNSSIQLKKKKKTQNC